MKKGFVSKSSIFERQILCGHPNCRAPCSPQTVLSAFAVFITALETKPGHIQFPSPGSQLHLDRKDGFI